MFLYYSPSFAIETWSHTEPGAQKAPRTHQSPHLSTGVTGMWSHPGVFMWLLETWVWVLMLAGQALSSIPSHLPRLALDFRQLSNFFSPKLIYLFVFNSKYCTKIHLHPPNPWWNKSYPEAWWEVKAWLYRNFNLSPTKLGAFMFCPQLHLQARGMCTGC